MVVTDRDEALAEQLAAELAERACGVRHRQPPPFPAASVAPPVLRRCGGS